MSVLLISLFGVLAVLLLILWLKVHPLLALLIGSLFLLAATPEEIRLRSTLSGISNDVVATANPNFVALKSATPDGSYRLLLDSASVSQSPVVELKRASSLDGPVGERTDLNWFTLEGTSEQLDTDAKIVAAAEFEQASTSRWTSIGGRLADGFAKTFRKLGIPVTMAAIVGICLLESGAAARLVAAIIGLFGTRGTAPALTVSGFVLGIPVFFDNVFYLLLPLAKAVGRARPEKFLSAVMAIIVGATMAHSLVPPTPGPLFVAELLNVSVGMMMIGGFIVGGAAASCGFAYGVFCNRWIKLSPDQVSDGEVVAAEAQQGMSLWIAALPIAVPILLLGGSEIVEFFSKDQPATAFVSQLHQWTAVFNDPSLIFIGAAVVAITILRSWSSADKVKNAVAKGLSDAGVIVLLTSAGGAFGASLQQLDIADAIGSQFAGLTTPWGMLFTAFFLTTIIRAAQGSATVAMLTSSAIVGPVIASTELPFHPIYVALAIGCGSKPLPWMNDSGFWQVATMTGMTTRQTLITFTGALTIMGCVGFAVTLLGAWLLPLV